MDVVAFTGELKGVPADVLQFVEVRRGRDRVPPLQRIVQEAVDRLKVNGTSCTRAVCRARVLVLHCSPVISRDLP